MSYSDPCSLLFKGCVRHVEELPVVESTCPELNLLRASLSILRSDCQPATEAYRSVITPSHFRRWFLNTFADDAALFKSVRGLFKLYVLLGGIEFSLQGNPYYTTYAFSKDKEIDNNGKKKFCHTPASSSPSRYNPVVAHRMTTSPSAS